MASSAPQYTLTELVVIGVIAEALVYGLVSLYNHRSGRKLSFQAPAPAPVPKQKLISEKPYCLRDPVHLAFSGKVVPNRLVKAPMTERVCVFDRETETEHGMPNETLFSLLRYFTKNGAMANMPLPYMRVPDHSSLLMNLPTGIIITGNILVDKHHLEAVGNPILDPSLPSSSNPEYPHPYTSAYATLATRARQHSPQSLVIAQLNHPGAHSSDALTAVPVSPSGVRAAPAMGETFNQPRALSEPEIRDIINKFAYASYTLYLAGFDGIQLHAAHGYLLTQFLSPLTNLRTDGWGGSAIEDRARIVLEIVDAVREICPREFSISVKLNSHDFLVGGFTNEDALGLCKLLEGRGVDFVEISGGTYDSMVEAFTHQRESTRKREAHFIEFSERLRAELCKTRVVLTGGFKSADGMARAIEDGACDFVGLARATAAEPRLGASLLASRTTRARPTLVPDHIGLQVGAALVQLKDIGEGREPTDFAKQEEAEKFLKALGVGA
ncbi:hypothetical protein FRC10_001135 [Ceratobasidium sp. 414]|nr:hypothetical protein FRC10_001135 [Ceratobasidium sp. 414]